MADINVTYEIVSLIVTMEAGEIFKRVEKPRDNHMLVALSNTRAAIINTTTGYRTVPSFEAVWTVNGKHRTMNLRDLIDAVGLPGMTYGQFLEKWHFAGSDRLQKILDQEANGS
jgi:hypothetical protein